MHQKKLPVDRTSSIHNSSPLAPEDVCLSSVKRCIFTVLSAFPLPCKCLRSVGAADGVAEYDLQGTFVCTPDQWGINGSSYTHTWLMHINTPNHVYADVAVNLKPGVRCLRVGCNISYQCISRSSLKMGRSAPRFLGNTELPCSVAF